ncbi:aspartic peptidase domain-containing protein [Rhexocercosporidium sp. MPI-PUGE-AT-0058]|nr:aspartic peptidase domain-containing protein [Rhexocercosporidium sp. MPI-PUGE-AT-0058]
MRPLLLRNLLAILILSSSPTTHAATGECSIPPLYLPWRNITVSLDGLAVTRGIELGIGTPSQIFSLRPATTLNNTRISNVLECVSLSNISCIGAAGGVFDATKSSTYEVSIRNAWNGSQADQETATGSYVYFNDVLKFERNGSVLGFPLVNAGLDGGPDNGIPLGVDSSFLSAATKSLVAPSSAWSLWAGSRSLNPVDGALIIGGYDSSRTLGNFTTLPIGTWTSAQPCPLQVSVGQIKYTFANGTSVNLLAAAESPLNACLDTAHQRFTFAPAVAGMFGNITGYNTSSLLTGLNYPIADRPNGNLTVILSNGYTTVIPNEELFTVKRGSDEYGRYAITNASLVETGISYNAKSDPANIRAVLGGMFLTQNLLVVDYEEGTFRMAPARQGALEEKDRSLVKVCTQKSVVNATKPGSSPTSTPSNEVSEKGRGKSNVGAIAGGVVGGILGLVVIIGGAWFVTGRKKRFMEEKNRRELANTHRQSSMVSVSELPSPLPPTGPQHQFYELPSP